MSRVSKERRLLKTIEQLLKVIDSIEDISFWKFSWEDEAIAEARSILAGEGIYV